nr:MAG TPA: PlyB like endolysin [Caudoviricetes sp.]
MGVKKAVDISEWNGIINFEILKHVVDYVIIRCGYGQDMASQDDKQWIRNVTECERLGIPYGVYFYSYAKTKARIEGEIKHCLRLLRGHSPNLPVFFDSEEKGTQAVAKHNAKRFCDAMITNGYKAGIYASKSWFENYIGETWGYDLWIARYANALGVDNVDIWQYSSNGRVYGIDGRCDVNHVYKEYGGSNITPSTPQEPVTHEKTRKELIALGQQHAINFTGVKIAVDGIVGKDTKRMGVRVVQRAMNLDYGSTIVVDGIVGRRTLAKAGRHYVKRGEKQYLVTALEILCLLQGKNPNGVECPGIFGGGLASACGTEFVYAKDMLYMV